MLTAARLIWRMHRWELTFLIGGCLAMAAAMAFVAWQLGMALPELTACFASMAGTGCRSTDAWVNQLLTVGTVLTGATIVAPLAVGLFLGAPLVAREIEHRTAPIAWSLSASRRRWLIGRVLPLGIVIGIVLLVLGQASEAVLRANGATQLGFRQYDMHGPLVAARGLAVFGIGVAVGAVVGRTLPGILVTGLATVALVFGVQLARDQLMRAEAVWLPMGAQSDLVQVVYGSGFQATDGHVITWEQAYQQYPDSFNEMGDGAPPGMTAVWNVVPPERYELFLARDIAVFGAVFAAASGLALGVVQARRPR